MLKPDSNTGKISKCLTYTKIFDKEKAEDLFDIYLPLIRHEQQFGIGLALRKFVLQQRGIIQSLNVRSPGPVLTEDDIKEMNYLLKRLHLKLTEKGLTIPKGIN